MKLSELGVNLTRSNVTTHFTLLGCGEYHLCFSRSLEIGMVRKAKKSKESDLDSCEYNDVPQFCKMLDNLTILNV